MQLTEVTGGVAYRGEPVPDATVVFQPEGGPPAIATTDSQGRFELNTGGKKGVLAGECLVAITSMEPLPHEVDPETLDADFDADDDAAWEASLTDADIQAMANQRSLIPQRYSHVQTSGLTAEVTAGENNDFDFVLTD